MTISREEELYNILTEYKLGISKHVFLLVTKKLYMKLYRKHKDDPNFCFKNPHSFIHSELYIKSFDATLWGEWDGKSI